MYRMKTMICVKNKIQAYSMALPKTCFVVHCTLRETFS